MNAGPFSLTQEVLIDAPCDLVYKFFTNPDLLMRWMGVSADINPVVGGAMVVNVTGKATTRGEFTELVPGERLVFTWGFTQPGATEVTVALSAPPESPEQTLVRLQHRGFDDAENCQAHEQGWAHYLARLQLAGAGKSPGVDSRITS